MLYIHPNIGYIEHMLYISFIYTNNDITQSYINSITFLYVVLRISFKKNKIRFW